MKIQKRKITLWFGLVFFPLLLLAQEKTNGNGRIGFEFGANVFFGEAAIPDRVRASKSAHEYDDFYYGYPNSNPELDHFYGGITYEYFFLDNRLGFTVGLRFSQLSSKLSADWDQNYFVWLFRQDQTNTDYLTIRNIQQKNYYIGVPLEFRYVIPRRKDSAFRQYFKLGTAVNYRLSSTNSIEFFEPAMNKYADAVGNQIEKPSLFNAWIYPAFGFRFGRLKNVWFNIEADLPGFMIGKKAHPFIRIDAGMGMQFSIQIPLNNNIQHKINDL